MTHQVVSGIPKAECQSVRVLKEEKVKKSDFIPGFWAGATWSTQRPRFIVKEVLKNSFTTQGCALM